MKKLMLLLLFIPLVSFGQQNAQIEEYFDNGNKVIEKTWVDGNQTKTLIETTYSEEKGYRYFIHEDGVEVGLILDYVREYGRYWRLNVSIVNNSKSRIDFIPNDIYVKANGVEKNQDKYVALSYEEYTKKVKRRQNGNAFLTGFAMGLSSYNAGNTYSDSYTYGTNENSYTYSSSYSPTLANLQHQQNSETLNELADSQQENMNYINEGYLKNHSLFPNTTLEGYILIPFNKKITDIDVSFKIGQMLFDFSNNKWHY